MNYKSDINWSACRVILYQELVSQFGPHAEWDAAQRPGRGLDKKYHAFKEHFAKTFGARSARAVQQQINWSVGYTRHLKRGHIQCWVTNAAAAYTAGFIRFADFPVEAWLGPKGSR
jgi:hypothetical protein